MKEHHSTIEDCTLVWTPRAVTQICFLTNVDTNNNITSIDNSVYTRYAKCCMCNKRWQAVVQRSNIQYIEL